MSAPDTTSKIHEIAPELFRISTYFPALDMQFHQFLARDEEPLLYHTGMRGMFPVVRDAVAKLIDPRTLRWIGFSHFEADECGSLNEWLALAPDSEALCSLVAKAVSVDDFASRPSRALDEGEVLSTGRFRFRQIATPHVPHAWDASLLFEETQAALLCSDLFHQLGDLEPVTTNDLVDRFHASLLAYRGTPFDHYLPYTPRTRATIERLAALKPKRLLPMHGSTFEGDGERSLLRVAAMMNETLGPASAG